MKIFDAPTKRQLDAGLAVLRAVVGAVFVAHGAQKLFVYGIAGVSGGFEQMGVPFPGVIGPAIGVLELLGGVALIVGVLTRLAALGLAGTMAGAILFVHLPAGFFLPNGSEFALTLLGSVVLLALTGAGGLSVDALLARRERAPAIESQEAAGLRRRRAA